MAELRATVRFVEKIPVIDLSGELNAFTEESVLKDGYADAIGSGAKTIGLNFSEAGYINSKGIALIVGFLARARRDGVHIIAYGVSRHYQEIFEITRLTDYMQVFTDERSALTMG